MEIIIIISAVLSAAAAVFSGLALWRSSGGKSPTAELDAAFDEQNRAISDEMRVSRTENREMMASLGAAIGQNQRDTASLTDRRLAELTRSVTESQRRSDDFQTSFASDTERRLEAIRVSTETALRELREENSAQLGKMRATVDEKLQKTLEDRIGQSFQAVSAQLEQVYKGLGEMQSLASGVGDLKRVLSNVKTRGILGEVQLGAILSEIMPPEQYGTNVSVVPGSREAVEFAVKLPGTDGVPVWLPIDSKFPCDAYEQLLTASDSGDPDAVRTAQSVLSARIRQFARDVHDKYIAPPHTTDFAIMFLPFEGLYAEVVRLGLLEPLQREYRVSVAGPTTTAALLNSLQMGFRTLAIEKRSSEVWKTLASVRSEFEKFSDVLASAQNRLSQASGDLDKLVGTRTRVILRALRGAERGEEGALPERDDL